MNIKELIGQQIKDILVWSKTDVNGLDEFEVSIVLNNGTIVRIPFDLTTSEIEKRPKDGAKSLFTDLNDIPIFHVNPEKKPITEIVEAQKKRNSSFIGIIKKTIGIKQRFPREYRPYHIEYNENKLKNLKNQKIVDFLLYSHPTRKIINYLFNINI